MEMRGNVTSEIETIDAVHPQLPLAGYIARRNEASTKARHPLACAKHI
jgi:hypothetical protein